jgi:tRNA-specific 2-thiouridylase
MGKSSQKIAVGLSGGVDSSVAAALLLEQGHDVMGITMEIYDGSIVIEETQKHACFGPGEKEDVENAESVCKSLGIPFYSIDLKKEYKKQVIDYFRKEYLSGRTPNPCIVCNRQLKFGFLLEKAKKSGVDFDLFATGHYARITKQKEHFLLKKAFDLSKDQTYFLYSLTQKQLSRTLFPIGSYEKQQVRKIARTFGLKTADNPESQDFLAGGDYSVLFDDREVKKGDIVDKTGKVLGKHKGIIHYTVGQRRGLGIASDRPLYVAKIDAGKNRIVVCGKDNLFSKGLIASDFNFSLDDAIDSPRKVKAKIRLNQNETGATVFPTKDKTVKIMFDQPQMAVSPGQSVVLYLDDVVLGGGIIKRAITPSQ